MTGPPNGSCRSPQSVEEQRGGVAIIAHSQEDQVQSRPLSCDRSGYATQRPFVVDRGRLRRVSPRMRWIEEEGMCKGEKAWPGRGQSLGMWWHAAVSRRRNGPSPV